MISIQIQPTEGKSDPLELSIGEKQTGKNFGADFSKAFPHAMDILGWIRDSIRPWSDFFNMRNIKSVDTMNRLSQRMLRNVQHFLGNYAVVFVTLMFYYMVSSPLILLVMTVFGFGSYKLCKHNSVINVFGIQLNLSQQLMGLNAAAIPVLFMVGVTSIIIWSFVASILLISAHAALYNIDAIVTEDTENFRSEVI